MDLLDDLGPQLRALTGGQPAQPGDRVPGVTRRARGMRRTRLAVAATAALAVLAPAGVLVANLQQDPQPQFAHSDITTWPDRSVQADRGIGEGAVSALRDQDNAAVLDVHWLYRARVHLPDNNPAYLAVFTAEVSGQRLLVVAQSFGTVLDARGFSTESDPVGSTPWVTTDRTVLDPSHPVRYVGDYLPYTRDQEHLSFAVVLADPHARTLTWRTSPLPFATTTVGEHDLPGVTGSRDGVFTADLGAVTGPATIELADARGHNLRGPLGTGRSQSNLSVPPDPDLPAPWQAELSAQGQTEESSPGRWTTSSFSSAPSGPPQRTMTAFVRCYGDGTLHVSLQLGERSQPARQGAVACDGASHQAFAPIRIGEVQQYLSLYGDRLQVLNVHFGAIG